MAVKINALEFQNIKRIRAVKLSPTKNGLTVIGGKNNNGKSSTLDSIAWALGGDAFRPSKAARNGSVIPPHLHVVMSNGIVVERGGKNSTLKVTDPTGKKAGQQLLNSFISQMALDLPRFMEASDKEKASTLLKIIGVGDRLEELEREEREKYNERQAIGRIADQKEKFAAEQAYYSDVPEEPVSASELIRQQQEILARNGRNQELRMQATELERREADLERQLSEAFAKAAEWEKKAETLKEEYEKVSRDKETAFLTCEQLQDESTEELEQSIANIEELNRKVRANLDKTKAEDDARQYREQYQKLTGEVEAARDAKKALLAGADLPLEGLSVEEGELVYDGQKWDNMSGSDRLKVSTAIVRKLNPECGFVLVDKLEQFDADTLKAFGEWAEKEGLQVIGTRVTTGEDGDCTIIIEDGYSYDTEGNRTSETEAVPDQEPAEPEPPKKKWKKGAF